MSFSQVIVHIISLPGGLRSRVGRVLHCGDCVFSVCGGASGSVGSGVGSCGSSVAGVVLAVVMAAVAAALAAAALALAAAASLRLRSQTAALQKPPHTQPVLWPAASMPARCARLLLRLLL